MISMNNFGSKGRKKELKEEIGKLKGLIVDAIVIDYPIIK